MDTKWKNTKGKKVRQAVGYLSFMLTFCILIGIVIPFSARMYMHRLNEKSFSPMLRGQSDYQNSRRFEEYMSEYMKTCLSMAVGGPVVNPYYGYAETEYETTVIEDYPEEEILQMGESIEMGEPLAKDIVNVYGDGYDESQQATAEQKEVWKRQALLVHERSKWDKNILYTISYDNKVLYSNAEGNALNELPEGYNFLMTFDGEKVSITKDGMAFDIYGDGYYREDGQGWFVPGYKNYRADESIQKARVTLAVIQTPQIFINSNYAQGDTGSYDSQIYWIAQNTLEDQKDADSLVIAVCLMFAALFLWILLRKEKTEAEQKIADIFGKLHLEFKLILLVAAFIFGFSFATETRQILREIYYYGEDFYIGAISNLWINLLLDAGKMLPLFFIIYLFIIDIRFHKQTWKHSLCENLVKLFYMPGKDDSLQKRMLKKYGIVFLVTVCMVFVAVAALLYCIAYEGTPVFLILAIILLFIFIVISVGYRNYQVKLANDMEILVEQISMIRGGNLTQELIIPEDGELAEAFHELNEIQQGMDMALKEQMKSERMKVELVSNVSHDIKTPLTSIISYIELLKQEENLPEHIKDYITVLDTKSDRLKEMVKDVFEVSKAASGQLNVSIERLEFGKLLRQTLADMSEKIAESGFIVKADIPEEQIYIEADGQRIYRVFQNLIQNALQYSLQGSRIYVTLQRQGEIAVAFIKNTSNYELMKEADFTERFFRGDTSRSDGGSGLGLSIAKSFTEACNGILEIEANADLFIVSIKFHICP